MDKKKKVELFDKLRALFICYDMDNWYLRDNELEEFLIKLNKILKESQWEKI